MSRTYFSKIHETFGRLIDFSDLQLLLLSCKDSGLMNSGIAGLKSFKSVLLLRDRD